MWCGGAADREPEAMTAADGGENVSSEEEEGMRENAGGERRRIRRKRGNRMLNSSAERGAHRKMERRVARENHAHVRDRVSPLKEK